jgi:hypothetical protein
VSALRDRIFRTGLVVAGVLVAAVVAWASSGHGAGSAPQTHVSPIAAADSMAALTATATVPLPAPLTIAANELNDTGGANVAAGGKAVPEALIPGAVDSGHAHQLLAGVGSMKLDVYAATTAKERVCYLDTSGLAGCVDTFDDQAPVVFLSRTPTKANASADGYLAGLAPDRVTRVELVTGGNREEGVLRNNAFFFELHGPPDSLIITYDDGSTQVVDAY